jgi:hypothetical protein
MTKIRLVVTGDKNKRMGISQNEALGYRTNENQDHEDYKTALCPLKSSKVLTYIS